MIGIAIICCVILSAGMKLQNKKAVITGGSKGIGRAVAKAYATLGASVVICGRNEGDLIDAKQEISSLGEIDYVVADISNPDDVERFAAILHNKWDKLDLLVNNASILGPRLTIKEYPEPMWLDVINVNINGQFFVTKALLPLMMNPPEGASIINLTSSVGRVGRALWGAYSVSKFGMEGFTQVLAEELKPYGIRVNAVNPGATRTAMRAQAYPDEDPMTLPAPDDIVPVFVYLASDESAGVTGQSLNARDWFQPPLKTT